MCPKHKQAQNGEGCNRKLGFTKEKSAYRYAYGGGQRRQGRNTREGEHADPKRQPDQQAFPGSEDQKASICGDPFAAVEVQPHRIAMADKGKTTRDKPNISLPANQCESQNGEACLKTIKQQGRDREILTAGSQDICRANIARTNIPDIPESGQSRQQHTKGDGSHEIPANRSSNEPDCHIGSYSIGLGRHVSEAGLQRQERAQTFRLLRYRDPCIRITGS